MICIDTYSSIVGSQYHYKDLATCCTDRFWWVEDLCTASGGSGGTGGGASGPAPAPGPNPYYPNWTDGTCVNDGKQ